MTDRKQPRRVLVTGAVVLVGGVVGLGIASAHVAADSRSADPFPLWAEAQFDAGHNIAIDAESGDVCVRSGDSSACQAADSREPLVMHSIDGSVDGHPSTITVYDQAGGISTIALLDDADREVAQVDVARDDVPTTISGAGAATVALEFDDGRHSVRYELRRAPSGDEAEQPGT